MNPIKTSEAIQFKHEENHLSFAQAFMSAKAIFIKKENYTYELVIVHLAREDGSGNKFLFKAYMKSASNGSNYKHEFLPEEIRNYTGYLNLKRKKGSIKLQNKPITWNV